MLNYKHIQKGFSLVEVLVAVVILSIGLLGLAGLQVTNLQFNKSAAQRSQATILAHDIIDRMRANRTQAEAGAYDLALGAGPSGNSNCESSPCSSADLASYDKNQWLCLLGKWDTNAACTNFGIEGHLLEGDGKVVRAGSLVTVTIRWTDDRTISNTAVNTYEARLTEIEVSTVL